MTPATLVDLCDRYLQGRHCVLWGTAHEVLTEKGRRAAAEWFAGQITELLSETEMGLVSTRRHVDLCVTNETHGVLPHVYHACPNGVHCVTKACPNTHPPMTAARLSGL